MTFVLVLFLAGLTAPAEAAIKPGTACSKIGKTSTFNGKKFTCIKSKKKLIWNKGVVIKRVTKASPSPSATASPSPSATASPSPSAAANPTVSNSSSVGCATPGGNCAVGDTGPGGGKVFYVQNGSKLGAWKYLEVAPSTWNGENDPAVPWCPASPGSLGTSTSTGTGSANTQRIVSQCIDTNADFSVAAKVASSYRGGGKSDWFLPSKDELGLLFEARAVFGKVQSGFAYWSSSQESSSSSWSIDLTTGASNADENVLDRFVRPIRAFG